MDASTTYSQQAATTASPAQLVLMLYDAALAHTEAGRLAVVSEPRQLEVAHRAIGRVQAIVRELQVTLDHERGGAVADNLADLYGYCQDLLLQANLRKDAAPLEEVVTVLTPLRDAWDQACVRTLVGAA